MALTDRTYETLRGLGGVPVALEREITRGSLVLYTEPASWHIPTMDHHRLVLNGVARGLDILRLIIDFDGEVF